MLCACVVVVVVELRKWTVSTLRACGGGRPRTENAGRDGPPSCRHSVSGMHLTTHARHHPQPGPVRAHPCLA